MKDLVDKIQKEETLNEVSYKQNIGFEEMVKFYQKASPTEIKQMEKFAKADDKKRFRMLIKKVLGIELRG